MLYKRDGEKMITVEHLEKNYGEVKVLSDVSLNIAVLTVLRNSAREAYRFLAEK